MAWWKRSRSNTSGARRALTSAAALLGQDIDGGDQRGRVDRMVDWQDKAWTYYDEIGELRFAVGWIANGLSRVNLVAALPPRYQGDEPTAIDLEHQPQYRRYVELVQQIGGGPTGQAQMLAAAARLLVMVGVGYLYVRADVETDTFASWRILSQDEVRQQGGRIEVLNEMGAWVLLGESDVLQKFWKPHPRRSDRADSPVRALLGTLKEIKRLSDRVIADAESRLAGNGLLVLPSEFEFPKGQLARSDAEADADNAADQGDEFTEGLIETAALSMADQGTAAARVPLTIKVPGEHADKVRHVKFWTEFDAQLVAMREAAVKRFALGMDMPPEVVLGMGDSNHWSAWQISEEAVTLQIEPLSELICDALTIGVYRAMCIAEGLDPDEVILWYDTTDLTTRPDRSTSAAEAHSRLKLSDAAYLRELGLDVADMPTKEELRFRILMDVAKGAPTLAPAMLAAAGLLDQQVADAVSSTDQAPAGDTATPSNDTQPADRSLPTQNAALAAADMLVVRALELAGRRLRGAAGKGRPGGAESIECDDPTLLHTTLPATSHASLETLLAGAWDRVPPIAARLELDEQAMTAWLDGYARSLIACGHAHTFERLAQSFEAARHAVVAAR